MKVNVKIIGALVLVLFASASAEEFPGKAKLRNKYDTFAIFNRILRTFYPEIWHKMHELSLLDDFTYVYPQEVRFKIEAFCRPPVSDRIAGQMQPCSTYYPKQDPLMIGSFKLTMAGEVTAFDAGYADKEHKFYPFMETAADNHWSKERVDQELLAAHAKFTPDKRTNFLEMLKKQDFTVLLGKYRLKSIDFIYDFEGDLEHDNSGPILQWVVQTEIVRDHKRKTCLLFFEPFDGTLRRMKTEYKLFR